MKTFFKEVARHAIFAYQFHEAENNVDDERAQELAVEYITSDDYRAGFPIVVCLCGSTRFWRTFQEASLRETLAGKIVLSIGAASGTDDEHFGNLPKAEYDRVKAMLDGLHMRKIELADEVLILNVDNYIGESTARELAYARHLGKPVRYWQERIVTEADIIAARGRVAVAEEKGEQQDFSDALLSSPDLTPEMVKEWLDAIPRVCWCACEGGDHSLIVCPSCGLPPYWRSV